MAVLRITRDNTSHCSKNADCQSGHSCLNANSCCDFAIRVPASVRVIGTASASSLRSVNKSRRRMRVAVAHRFRAPILLVIRLPGATRWYTHGSFSSIVRLCCSRIVEGYLCTSLVDNVNLSRFSTHQSFFQANPVKAFLKHIQYSYR